MRLIRRLERFSRPRLSFVFRRRFTDVSSACSCSPGPSARSSPRRSAGWTPCPALGVVVLSLGVLLEDALVAVAGMLLAAAGIVLEIALGAAAIHGISSLL